LRSRLSKQAMTEARQFTVDAMVEKTEACYYKVLALRSHEGHQEH